MAVFTHSIKAIKLTERRNIWTHLNEIIYRFSFYYTHSLPPSRKSCNFLIFCLCHWTLFNFTGFRPPSPSCLDSLRQKPRRWCKKEKKCDSTSLRVARVSEHRENDEEKNQIWREKRKKSLSYRSFRLSCSMCCNKSEFMYLTTWNISPLFALFALLFFSSISCVRYTLAHTVCTIIDDACMSSLVCQMNHNLSECGERGEAKEVELWEWWCDLAVKSTFICLRKRSVEREKNRQWTWWDLSMGKENNVSKIDCNTFSLSAIRAKWTFIIIQICGFSGRNVVFNRKMCLRERV